MGIRKFGSAAMYSAYAPCPYPSTLSIHEGVSFALGICILVSSRHTSPLIRAAVGDRRVLGDHTGELAAKDVWMRRLGYQGISGSHGVQEVGRMLTLILSLCLENTVQKRGSDNQLL